MSFQTKDSSGDHSRTIIHVDIDCFYAQVEMLKNEQLRNLPLGIQQKNIVVTSNYIARNYGIKKCMLVSEAKKLCPNLNLVNGEDLHDYRAISYKITNFLVQKYTQKVERLGLDENFIDVTELIKSKTNKLKNPMKMQVNCDYDVEEEEENVVRSQGNLYQQIEKNPMKMQEEEEEENVRSEGNLYQSDKVKETCECGCKQRLIYGSIIAQEIRRSIYEEFKLTCCAGIAHNKLLAKLSGALNKPNQQTLVFPISAADLLLSLNSLSKIPGIGKAMCEQLNKVNIQTIGDLQNCDLQKLVHLFNNNKEKALQVKNWSFGIDSSPVKISGRPHSIGLESSSFNKSICVKSEIEAKFLQLLSRLMVLVCEDGRVPRSIKLTVRKTDGFSRFNSKETKQCKINPLWFKTQLNQSQKMIILTKENEAKLLKTIMGLFTRIVDVNKPFHVTLLGLSFTKFIEPLTGIATVQHKSIKSFLNNSLEVQSLTNFENKSIKDGTSSLMDYINSPSGYNTDGSESEVEPSPKKPKFLRLEKRNSSSSILHSNSAAEDLFSPSKLKVAELRLNASPKDNNDLTAQSVKPLESFESMIFSNCLSAPCPPDVDGGVFKELTSDMQQVLWKNHVRKYEIEQTTKQQKIPRTIPNSTVVTNYLFNNLN